MLSLLQTAGNDARRLAEALAAQQHFHVHAPLLNAKGEEIRDLLKTLPAKVGADDRVLFYFAGHGIAAGGDDGPAGYSVPADADPTEMKTFIPMEFLHHSFNALPCRHLLLILDCCFSGAFKWSSNFRAIGTLMPKKIYKERFDRFVQEPARRVIISAAYDQKAPDVLQGDSSRALTGLHGAVNSVVLDPVPAQPPAFVISGSDDKIIRLWSPANLTPTAHSERRQASQWLGKILKWMVGAGRDFSQPSTRTGYPQ